MCNFHWWKYFLNMIVRKILKQQVMKGPPEVNIDSKELRVEIDDFVAFLGFLNFAHLDEHRQVVGEISVTPQTQQCRQNPQTAEECRQFPPSALLFQ